MQNHPGCQSVLSADGEKLFSGEWDPLALYEVLTGGDDAFWANKRVLDIGANTCGLSLEISRRGADVLALEPDPYGVTYARSHAIVDALVKREGLRLKVLKKGLFQADEHKDFDVVLCLGLLYHFRYPQLVLDYLSTLRPHWLFLSTQVQPGDSLAIFNRMDPSLGLKPDWFPKGTVLTGWHPTRPMIERMLRWAGFDEIVSLTDQPYTFPTKQKGLTNSAYYRCRRVAITDPMVAMKQYYAR